MKLKEPKSPREFFSTLNLSVFPEDSANYIKDEILTSKDLDTLDANDPEFISFEEMIHEKYPSALVEKAPPVVETPAPVIEEKVEVKTEPASKEMLLARIKLLKRMLSSEGKTPEEKKVLNGRIKLLTKMTEQ